MSQLSCAGTHAVGNDRTRNLKLYTCVLMKAT